MLTRWLDARLYPSFKSNWDDVLFQEEVLFLPLTTLGRDSIRLAQLQPIAAALMWHRQRKLWDQLKKALLAPIVSQIEPPEPAAQTPLKRRSM